jgi:predicted phage baseplate assembly protein
MSGTANSSGCCSCCSTTSGAAAASPANRPGLPALSLRLGGHASFFAAMQARLSSADLSALAPLRTRETSDFAIALLDAWSTIGDVLAFYQERVANEGYLRTATSRFSVLQLGRLVGYDLRPGVAASAFLAYTLNDGPEVPIPAGARVQSTPGPNETPVFFETAETLRARAEWNQLPPRLSQLPQITSDHIGDTLTFVGTTNYLKPGDRLLFKFGATFDLETSVVRQIQKVELSYKDLSKNVPEDRTTVTLVPISDKAAQARKKLAAAKPANGESLDRFLELARFGASSAVLEESAGRAEKDLDAEPELVAQLKVALSGPELPARLAPAKLSLPGLVEELRTPPTAQPATAARLTRDAAQIFRASSDVGPQLLGHFFPELQDNLYRAFAAPEPLQEVFVFRQSAFLFGNNAPKRSLFERSEDGHAAIDGGDWTTDDLEGAGEQPTRMFLDSAYPAVLPGEVVLLESATLTAKGGPGNVFLGTAQAAAVRARTAYRVSAPTTQLDFAESWWTPSISTIRDGVIYTRAEKLTLAREPITDPLGGEGDAARTIELDGVHAGLTPGRWIIVSGMRRLSETVAIPGAELVMIAAVDQTDFLAGAAKVSFAAGDPHTVLTLADEGLAYTYVRASVTIFGNVVLSTQGETRGEVLGSGDAARSLQAFTLKKPPLTYVPAATPSGIASTLEVRVNDVVWKEAATLAASGPGERRYVVRIADDGTTSVTFGTGTQGARLPTGTENVKAVYRSGIGRGGNVDAGQLNLLQTRPLGVRDVVNPLPASGGADADTRDQARRNVPLSVMALDRLVSVSDYAFFSRSFAGIAKATAERLVRAGRPLIHVTISGQENVPLAPDSLLLGSLKQALADLGDPALPVEVTVCPLAFLSVRAGVKIADDRVWEVVVQQVRDALLGGFGFDCRDVGQNVYLSEVISIVQNVDGVDYVDVDALASVSETDIAAAADLDQILATLAAGGLPTPPVVAGRDAQGARLVYLNPTLSDLLVLQEITP